MLRHVSIGTCLNAGFNLWPNLSLIGAAIWAAQENSQHGFAHVDTLVQLKTTKATGPGDNGSCFLYGFWCQAPCEKFTWCLTPICDTNLGFLKNL
jgi:hypothetical protein